MLNAKTHVSSDLSHQIADKGKYSTTRSKGLIHALGAVESCTDGHDIHYYCRVAKNYI